MDKKESLEYLDSCIDSLDHASESDKNRAKEIYEIQINNCVCKRYDLEQGDELYYCLHSDSGVTYEYIEDIKFCPVCGRKLQPEFSRLLKEFGTNRIINPNDAGAIGGWTIKEDEQ